jgi:hypothetical protein
LFLKVTGDNALTAINVARNCNILSLRQQVYLCDIEKEKEESTEEENELESSKEIDISSSLTSISSSSHPRVSYTSIPIPTEDLTYQVSKQELQPGNSTVVRVSTNRSYYLTTIYSGLDFGGRKYCAKLVL